MMATNLKLPPMIVLATGATEATPELVGEIIEQLIGALDAVDGDPDLEDSEACETNIDANGNRLIPSEMGYRHDPWRDDDCAEPDHDAERTFAEWHTLPSVSRRAGKIDGTLRPDRWPVDDDTEDDDADEGVEDHPLGFDPEEDMCLAGDDRVASGSCTGAMLICEDTGPGDADDAEVETWTHPDDCDEEAHVGRRQPPRQLDPRAPFNAGEAAL